MLAIWINQETRELQLAQLFNGMLICTVHGSFHETLPYPHKWDYFADFNIFSSREALGGE